MSELVKLPIKQRKTEDQIIAESMAEYDATYNELKDSMQQVITVSYTKNGDLVAFSNGLDAAMVLWMIENFKLSMMLGE